MENSAATIQFMAGLIFSSMLDFYRNKKECGEEGEHDCVFNRPESGKAEPLQRFSGLPKDSIRNEDDCYESEECRSKSSEVRGFGASNSKFFDAKKSELQRFNRESAKSVSEATKPIEEEFENFQRVSNVNAINYGIRRPVSVY